MSNLPRMSNGRLWHFSEIGCYPLFYLCADGGVLCPGCANGENGSEATEDPEADKQWRLIGCDAHWEGPPIQCDHCGADIESAYGDPDMPLGHTWRSEDGVQCDWYDENDMDPDTGGPSRCEHSKAEHENE